MEMQKEGASTTATTASDGGDTPYLVLELPLGDAASTFDLEKAVCSHGLFMMAPNHWDPLTKTLQRPLRLSVDLNNEDYEHSLMVRISQPAGCRHALQLLVFGTDKLSAEHREAILAQVKRMLRLSEEENQIVREFQKVYADAKERGFGRIFRSPTLFEDMVKCILLCNCQWSRTLSMATALCELQLELQCSAPSTSIAEAGDGKSRNDHIANSKVSVPKTPAAKESKRKRGLRKSSINLANRFSEVKDPAESNFVLENCSAELSMFVQETRNESMNSGPDRTSSLNQNGDPCQTSLGVHTTQPFSSQTCQSSGVTESKSQSVRSFPSPRELAKLDEKLLAKRCNLGYRASRILKLAQSVVGGRIQLRELEEVCSTPSLSNYDKLSEQLKEIDGFGPFTCANVLMCMGFYHVIPTDSETIRHLKQVHARNSTTQSVAREVELIYGKYKPFQFLAYWSEVWNFYEEWFGKMSDMSHEKYKLITAANMRPKRIEKRNNTS